MKIMRLGIIALMVATLLCGCSGNKATPTNEVLETDVSAVTSDESTPTSDISFSDGETAEETTSKPEISTAPTQPKNDTPEKTTSNKQDTTSKSGNQTQTKPKSPDKPTTSIKVPEKTTSSEETPKSAFAKPFDTETMKSELISYAKKSIGMTHITNLDEDFGGDKITPDNSTWLPPIETWNYSSSKADKLKQDICDDIKHWKGRGVTTFTLWFEKDNSHSGDYIIYVLIG